MKFTKLSTFDDVANFRDLRNAVPLCEIFKGTPLYNFTNSPCVVNYILCVALKPINKLREASSSRSARKT